MSDGLNEPKNRIAVSSRKNPTFVYKSQPRADNPQDRLPTISASQALQQSTPAATPAIPFELSTLDAFIAGNAAEPPITGGLRRGQICELYGPPGVGKTALWYAIL